MIHYANFDPVVRAHLLAEPWTTVIYGIFAILLYTYRLHAVRMARKMAESLSAKQSLEHVSRMMLALRDFSNTPLQTLYLTTALLRRQHGDDAELLDRMDRSLSRLRELNAIMSQYEAQAGWQHGGESIDAVATLQRDFTTNRSPQPPPAPERHVTKLGENHIPHMRRLIILGLSPNRFLKSFENWKMSSYPTKASDFAHREVLVAKQVLCALQALPDHVVDGAHPEVALEEAAQVLRR